MGKNLSCKDQGKTTINVTAAGAAKTKDDALFSLMDNIITQADKQSQHTCTEDCATGSNFCFSTVTFKDSVNYVRSPKAGVNVAAGDIIAQYSGEVTLQCHCWGPVLFWALSVVTLPVDAAIIHVPPLDTLA